MKGDGTPVSHMATRGHAQQRQTTGDKDNSIPLPAFQAHEEAVTPQSHNGNKYPSFLQVTDEENPLCRSQNQVANKNVHFDKHTNVSWDNISKTGASLPSLRS